MASKLNWKGDQVSKQVADNVAAALGEFGLRAEGYAKKELRKGHGVRYGTLRRSIHTAEPGYNWAGDDETPGPTTPERGGKLVKARKSNKRIALQLGSGLRYALPVHQGHHSFSGYHFLTIGVDKAKPELDEVLRKHQMKK